MVSKCVNEFYTNTHNDVLTSTTKSVIMQPRVKFSGGSIKWRDDSMDKRQQSLHINEK